MSDFAHRLPLNQIRDGERIDLRPMRMSAAESRRGWGFARSTVSMRTQRSTGRARSSGRAEG